MKVIDFRARPNTPEYMSYFDTPGKRERQERKLGFAVPGTQSLDAFMAEVDASVSRNSLAELRALDEITPRAPLFEDRRR